MIKNIIVIMSLFVMSGCDLGIALQKAGTGNEQYKTCVLHQIETYASWRHGTSERTVEKATEFVIGACRRQEEAYVVAMTDLAMTITGSMVSREKFLKDEEVTLRGDLHELTSRLVEEELQRPGAEVSNSRSTN